MSSALENLKRDIRMRLESDTMMPSTWLLIYLIPVISIVLMVLAVIASPFIGAGVAVGLWVILVLVSLLSFVVSIILTYKLVKRRNTHFQRQIFLSEDVLSRLKEITSTKGTSAEAEMATLERTLREVKVEETEKSAVLWAILSAIIFIASWYVYYFLMKDFYKHERREDTFFEDVGRVLGKSGITFTPPRRMKPIPDRSFVLYLIVTIITAGIFEIYWLYVLLIDPNEHFKYHIELEDELFKVLESGTA
ncbi:MAG: hypothetical protein QMD20_05865 [Candidatus Bathyarchaeia archaeon]|nr:hypothetical protein [Candidatus Bathyarchaeia archaeon]